MSEIYTNIDGQLVEASNSPEDRTFRSAWELNSGGVISINMPKAKEIFRDKLRQDRKPLLEKLDVEFYKAQENTDLVEQARVVDQKNILRDITEHYKIEEAKTPEELNALSLEVLINENRQV